MNRSSWLAPLQAASDARAFPLEHPRYNPRPAGTIREGSATEAVLIFLRSREGQWFNHFQIVKLTGRTAKSVDHALLYLRAQRLVEFSSDVRNSRYKRYRAIPRHEL